MKRSILAGLSVVAVGALSEPAIAQAANGLDAMLPDITLRGQGWGQLRNMDEIGEFLLALVEATLMTAAIAYHPTIVAAHRTRGDFDGPRALFVYALIGMVVGFLIMHHGYLIGFVLFGLGGLLRFKSDDTSADTMRLILVTLIGLCVGLNLPVVALITTLSGWAIIYLLGGPAHFGLEVRFSKKATLPEPMNALKDRLAERGFKTLSMSKSKFKPAVHFVVAGERGARRSALEREMAALADEKENAISDWHLD